MMKLTLGYGIAKKIEFKFGIMTCDPPNVLGKQEQTRKGCINQCFWSKFWPCVHTQDNTINTSGLLCC